MSEIVNGKATAIDTALLELGRTMTISATDMKRSLGDMKRSFGALQAGMRDGLEGVRQTVNSIAAVCRPSPEFRKMLENIHGPTAGEMFAQLSKGERGEHESQRHARRT